MKYLHAKPSDIADALGKGDYGKLAFPAKATLTNPDASPVNEKPAEANNSKEDNGVDSLQEVRKAS
jgi:hypothetical protein